MKAKFVIGVAVVGALLYFAWSLRPGRAPENAEPTPSAPAASAADRPSDEPEEPSLPSLEHESEREAGSRVAAESAATDPTSPVPEISGAAGEPVPPGLLRGRVIDTAGAPVAVAGIFAGPFVTESGRGIRPQTPAKFPVSEGGEASGRLGLSDEQGSFEVPRLAVGSVLHARGQLHVPVLAFDWRAQDPSTVEPLLVVARPAAVAGLVSDVEGRPVEGVRIAIRIPDILGVSLGAIPDRTVPLEYHTVSGADGRFEIADAPGVLGRRLVAEREGAVPHDQALAAEPETGVRIVLQVGAEPDLVVKGDVIDRQGKPVSEASVRLGSQVARTGVDGKFQLDATEAQPGSEIVAAKPGFLPGRAPFEPGSESVTLRLGPPAQRMAGRVLDAAGKPMRGIEVRALGLTRAGGAALEDLATWEGPGPFTAGDTDAEGKFEIGGLEDRAYVVGLLDRNSLRTMRTDPIRAGRTDVEIRFQAEGGTVKIAGRVVDRSGAPVPRAQVRLVREIVREEGGFREGVDVVRASDAEGLFDFGQVAFDVRAIHAGYPGELAFEHAFVPGEDLGSLVLLAFQRAEFQIDLTASEYQADSFGLLDIEGRPMTIVQYEGNLAQSAMRWAIVDRRSASLTALDGVETLLLYREGREVGRVPIRVVPGEMTVVRP